MKFHLKSDMKTDLSSSLFKLEIFRDHTYQTANHPYLPLKVQLLNMFQSKSIPQSDCLWISCKFMLN